ncbi:DNA-binding protein [Pseudomonas sp. Leaf15]|nr:DNA-binding protein [Pseudomonas sp. Leaf15]KTB58388.1 DNA-binding protein [Pseudomonas fluorescens ICMP 11288]PZZ99863.1 DNA-binding protein [Pseudomonas sp. Leaf98]
MEAVTGTIKVYNRNTREGLIALDGDDELVCLDHLSSAYTRWREGQRVQFARIHRPKGVFAFRIRLI